MKNFSIAIHGGAGTILRSSMTAEKEQALDELRQVYAQDSYRAHKRRSSQSVEEYIRLLENDGVKLETTKRRED